MAGRLEIGEEVPRLLGALVAEVRDALVAVGLGADDLVGILDTAANQAEGEIVREVAGVERHVDGERQRLGRGEHQLEARARELRALGQRTGDELRLPARSELGLDPQAATAVLDVAVEPAQDIDLERREHGLTVALEDECLRLVQAVDDRLGRAAAEGPPDQPLDLHRAGRPDVEKAGEPRVYLVGTDAQPLELVLGEQPPFGQGQRLAQRRDERSRRAIEEPRDIAADIAFGRLEADREIDGRHGLTDFAVEAFAVLGDIPTMRSPVWPGVRREELVGVAVEIPGPGHAHHLDVGLDCLDRGEQPAEDLRLRSAERIAYEIGRSAKTPQGPLDPSRQLP